MTDPMVSHPTIPKIIAIAGGSCSGKSTLAQYLCDSIGAGLCRLVLLDLKSGNAVPLPRYDFTTHQRLIPSEPQGALPYIVVEGIFLLDQPALRDVFDHSIYMMCAPELRLSRRLARDIAERGRTREDVLRQFHGQVEPAHKAYVSPSQVHADLVIDQTDYISDMTATIDRVMAEVGAVRPVVAPRKPLTISG